jgi:hypothetical protein
MTREQLRAEFEKVYTMLPALIDGLSVPSFARDAQRDEYTDPFTNAAYTLFCNAYHKGLQKGWALR